MEKLQFEFVGPTAWTWTFKDPERAESDYSRQRFFTFSVHHQTGTDRWHWYVVGLLDGAEYDDLNGKATSMAACIDAGKALFRKAGLDVEIPFPLAN